MDQRNKKKRTHFSIFNIGHGRPPPLSLPPSPPPPPSASCAPAISMLSSKSLILETFKSEFSNSLRLQILKLDDDVKHRRCDKEKQIFLWQMIYLVSNLNM